MQGISIFKKILRFKYIYISSLFFGLIFVFNASNLFSDSKIIQWIVIILFIFISSFFKFLDEDKNKDYYKIRNKKEKIIDFFIVITPMLIIISSLILLIEN